MRCRALLVPPTMSPPNPTRRRRSKGISTTMSLCCASDYTTIPCCGMGSLQVSGEGMGASPRYKISALAPKGKKTFSEWLSRLAVSNATAKPFKPYVRNLISDIGFEGFARRFCFEARSQPQSCPVTLSVVGGWSGASCARPVADSAAPGPWRVPSGPRPRSP